MGATVRRCGVSLRWWFIRVWAGTLKSTKIPVWLDGPSGSSAAPRGLSAAVGEEGVSTCVQQARRGGSKQEWRYSAARQLHPEEAPPQFGELQQSSQNEGSQTDWPVILYAIVWSDK